MSVQCILEFWQRACLRLVTTVTVAIGVVFGCFVASMSKKGELLPQVIWKEEWLVCQSGLYVSRCTLMCHDRLKHCTHTASFHCWPVWECVYTNFLKLEKIRQLWTICVLIIMQKTLPNLYDSFSWDIQQKVHPDISVLSKNLNGGKVQNDKTPWI